MHSFSAVSLITLAFAAFTSAAPVDLPAVGSLPDASLAVAKVEGSLPVALPAIPGIPARGIPDLPTILADLTIQVAPITTELQYIAYGNATYEVLSPILDELSSVIESAIGAVKALTSDPVDTVLGTATIAGIAQLVAGLICMIFSALGAVLKTVSAAEHDLVLPLLLHIGEIVGELLQLILSLVGGLLAELLPLVGSIVEIVVSLNIRSVASLLGINI